MLKESQSFSKTPRNIICKVVVMVMIIALFAFAVSQIPIQYHLFFHSLLSFDYEMHDVYNTWIPTKMSGLSLNRKNSSMRILTFACDRTRTPLSYHQYVVQNTTLTQNILTLTLSFGAETNAFSKIYNYNNRNHPNTNTNTIFFWETWFIMCTIITWF